MTESAYEQYTDPVRQLLGLGCPEGKKSTDYEQLGIGTEHATDLIRMIGDEELHTHNSDNPAVYAPIHAWRAVGQLCLTEAIDPLIGLLERIDRYDDDWVQQEVSHVLAKLGPAGAPALREYLSNADNGDFARIAAADALKHMGLQFPESRDDCVNILADALRNHTDNHEAVNGFLISFLVDLRDTNHLDLMEQAFAAGDVDDFVMGDWEDVQIALGIRESRSTPRKPRSLLDFASQSSILDSHRRRTRNGPDTRMKNAIQRKSDLSRAEKRRQRKNRRRNK